MVRNGVMYRRNKNCERGMMEQLVLPEKLRPSVKTALQDNSGHLGFERTLNDMRGVDSERPPLLASRLLLYP